MHKISCFAENRLFLFLPAEILRCDDRASGGQRRKILMIRMLIESTSETPETRLRNAADHHDVRHADQHRQDLFDHQRNDQLFNFDW
ncbi:MAG: hypothetical protein ACLVJ6_11805 [Merdibacter sp.]